MFGIEKSHLAASANTPVDINFKGVQSQTNSQERQQITEMPRVSFGRDLVRPKTSETTPFKEFINNPKFPTDFDVDSLKKWAADSGLTFSIDKYGVVEMRDSEGQLIRKTSRDYNDHSKIYDDRIFITDPDGNEGTFVKYSFERDICYYYNYKGGFPQNKAEINPDGEWYEKGKKLSINLATKEPLNSERRAEISSNKNELTDKQKMEQEIIEAAKSINFGENPIKDLRQIINESPEIVEKIMNAKDSKGEDLLSKQQLCKVLGAAAWTIMNSPEDILSVLADPNAIAEIEGASERGRAILQYIRHPAPSTLAIKEQMLAEKI